MSAQTSSNEQTALSRKDAPGLWELMRWSALALALTLGIAAVSIPLLRWLGFDGSPP